MIINVSKYYLDKCTDFANKQLETSKNLYAYRGEKNTNKMVEDIIIGKMGEVGVYTYLKDKGYDVNKPDFEIYKGRRKSYAADIISDCGIMVHVKSQSVLSRKRYGSSWLFQMNDSLITLPHASEYVILAAVEGRDVEILASLSAGDMVEYEVYEEPKVPRYRHTKRAIYLDKFKDSGIDLKAL